jgi:PAS domain S-box-containing protein
VESERWDLVVCVVSGGRAPAALRAVQDRDAGRDPPLVIVADNFEEAAEASQRLGGTVCLRGRGFAHLGPAIERGVREAAQRGAREEAAQFEDGQRAVLELISRGGDLREMLERIVRLIEEQAEGMFCSILVLDRERGTLHHGAAPSLPRALVESIDGSRIGPQAGSCGAAAYLREPVVVEDIGTHPNWVPYRHLVLPAGLRACWSSPILASTGGDVLGTFAMYYRDPRPPTERERSWVGRAAHLAAIAISRDRAERAVRQADARYRQIVDTAHEGVWLIDADARTLLVNRRTASLLGYQEHELLGRRIVDFMDEDSRAAAEGRFIRRMRTISEQYQFRFCRRDGTYFWALLSGSPIRDERGEVVGALGMLTDITELKRTERALRQSEAEFRVVFENAAIGMALADRDGRLVRTNPALQSFLGYDEGELSGRRFSEFSHPDDAQADAELHRSLTRGESPSYQMEKRFVRKDGAVVWGRLTASLVRPAQGKPHFAIGMIEDVTDRRRMEEAVRASERLRTMMYASVTDILFYVGVEPGNQFRFLSVNPAFLSSTGLPEHEVVNRRVEEVIPEPSRGVVLANYLRSIQERRTITWDEVSAYPAGLKYGEVSITPIFDADGRCTNLVGTVHDVTERRRAEERLARQAALLDEANDAITVRDLDGIIQYWNRGAERLYGWSSAEMIGRNVRDVLYRDPSQFDGARLRLLEKGAWSGELAHVNRAGRPITVDSSWTLIRDDQGRPRAVLGISSNITTQKELEAQVVRAQRLQSVGTLAGGIAHDFNNVLTVIGSGVQLALSELPPEHPARPPLADVEQAAAHGAELTRQILTFSRGDRPRRTIVELDRVVAEALALLRASIPRAVEVKTHFDPDAPEVLADPIQLQQIVMNLGSNAAQAMNGSGTLEVRVERVALDQPLAAGAALLPPGRYTRLVVSDTGPGMDEATLERIFDPFFTTKPPGQGTGLGLSVVHGLVHSHGGGIVVHSAPGKGAEFAVYFPAAAVPSRADHPPSQQATP